MDVYIYIYIYIRTHVIITPFKILNFQNVRIFPHPSPTIHTSVPNKISSGTCLECHMNEIHQWVLFHVQFILLIIMHCDSHPYLFAAHLT